MKYQVFTKSIKNKIMLSKKLLALACFITIISACVKDKGDVVAPNAIITTPKDAATYESGSNIPIEFTLSDDKSLSTYSFKIYADFSGNVMKSLDTTFTEGLSGTNQTVKRDLMLPVNIAAGKYVAEISVTDAASNKKGPIMRNFNIIHKDDKAFPTIDVVGVTDGSITDIVIGSDLKIDVKMLDQESGLGWLSVDLLNHNTSARLYTDKKDLSSSTVGTNYTQSYTIPTSGNPAGMYDLLVELRDRVNNTVTKTYSLRFKN